MKRGLAAVGIAALCLAPVHADVTITQTMTVEGPMAGAAGSTPPKMVLRIKGMKARADVDVMGQTVSSITDLAARQVTVLNAATKTADVVSAVPPGGANPPPGSLPQVNVEYKPTGRSRTVDGVQCQEHAFTVHMDFSEMAASGQLPPEAAEVMKGVRMIADGITCVSAAAAGAAEFAAFQKAAAAANLLGALGGLPPGQPGGMEKLMAAAASAPGIPYVTEFAMSFEGSGPVVEMMRQMGGIKLIQRTTSVSTEPIADEMFSVPADYRVEKK